MFVLLFYAKLNGFLGKGPLWWSQQTNPACDKYWWTNLLYINNFYPDGLQQEVKYLLGLQTATTVTNNAHCHF